MPSTHHAITLITGQATDSLEVSFVFLCAREKSGSSLFLSGYRDAWQSVIFVAGGVHLERNQEVVLDGIHIFPDFLELHAFLWPVECMLIFHVEVVQFLGRIIGRFLTLGFAVIVDVRVTHDREQPPFEIVSFRNLSL